METKKLSDLSNLELTHVEYDEELSLRAWARYCKDNDIETCVFSQSTERLMLVFKLLPGDLRKYYIETVISENWYPPYKANEAKEWTGIDMDGTISKWGNILHPYEYGEPLQGIIDIIHDRVNSGRIVKIFTARACPIDNPFHKTCARGAKEWIKKHTGLDLEVTYKKDVHMVELLDDRVIRVNFNKGTICGECLTHSNN